MTAMIATSRCDPSLIEAARGGDADALVALIAKAQPDIRRYAARNCRAADIDDAVQETLLLLYRRVGTLRAVTSFSAWLFAVARRASCGCCADQWGYRMHRKAMPRHAWCISRPKTFASIFPAPSSPCRIIIAR